MSEVSLHAFVAGRVQKVWFRKSTKNTAISLGLTGWVRNLEDGRVEVMAQGDINALRQLETWLSKGPELANVAEVNSEFVPSSDSYGTFEVR